MGGRPGDQHSEREHNSSRRRQQRVAPNTMTRRTHRGAVPALGERERGREQ
jgi:hypothetical protein